MCRKSFHDTREPFAITVGGQKLYVLTNPEDVAMVYRNNTTLSWDKMLNDLLVAFGVRNSVIPKLWQKMFTAKRDEHGNNIRGTAPTISPIHSTLDLYKRQLLPGDNLEAFSEKLLGCISESLRWKKISIGHDISYSGWVHQVSLKGLCDEVLVDATTRTLFGDHLYAGEPNLVQDLLDFNDDAWMLIFHYPQSAGSKLNKARNNLLRAFVPYIRSPEESRGDSAWMIKHVIKEQSMVDIKDEDRAALLLMIYWA